MRRRSGVGFGLVILVTVLVWRHCREAGRDAASGPSVAAQKAIGKDGRIAGRPRADAKALATSSLAGTVSDATTKAPVAGALVCADGSSDDLVDQLPRDPFCTGADAAGHYLLPNLLPATYVIHASARSYMPADHHPGGDPRQRSVVVAAAEHRTGIDIALRPGGVEITGAVADVTGGPIAHARVRGGGFQSGSVSTETDDHGQFSLWVAPGRTGLVASADGYAPQTATGRAPGRLEILLTPEASLAGTVVDAATGQPIEGARVDVSATEAFQGASASTLSGPSGAYRVGNLAPGRYNATARTEHGHGQTEGSLLAGVGQHIEGVVLKLRPAQQIEGTVVVAATQKPCADGHVTLLDAPHGRTATMRKAEGDRHVAEGVPPGTYAVNVRCRDFVARDSYPPVAITDKDVTGLVWEVDAGATLRGKVVTRSGLPVEGARLFAQTMGGARATAGSEWSSYDGTYEIRGLAPGSYHVEVYSERVVRPAGEFPVDIAAGAVVDHDFVLDDGGTLAGVVVDTQDTPVAGVHIVALPSGAPRPPSVIDCSSDVTGAFTCDALPAGDYQVVAQTSRFPSPGQLRGTDKQGQAVTVRPREVSTVRLVVEPQSGTIRGSVLDGDGKPVGDAFVSVAREDDAAGGPRSAVRQTRWSFGERPNLTAADGAFKVTRLAPGSYSVRAYRNGGGEAIAEHVAVGSTVTLRIKATGSIEGAARWSGDATTALSVTVQNRDTAYSRTEKLLDTRGHYLLGDLPSGHLQLTVETDGRRKQIELDLAEGEHKTGVDVELEDLVMLTGRVVEKGTTTPVAGIFLMVQGNRSPLRRLDEDGAGTSDAAGRFTLRNVSRGKVAIMGFARGPDGSHGFVHAERTVDGTGTVDIGDLELEKRGK